MEILKYFRDNVRNVSRNMNIKFEVCSFNCFGSISIYQNAPKFW